MLLSLRGEFDVDKARPGNVDRLDPLHIGRAGQQLGAQIFCQLSRVELEGFCQLHGSRGGKVTMCGNLGRFKSCFAPRAGRQFFQGRGQGVEQFDFYRQHACILRVNHIATSAVVCWNPAVDKDIRNCSFATNFYSKDNS